MISAFLQRVLGAVGFAQFKFYRCWVGGRWAERYIERRAGARGGWPGWCWVADPSAHLFDGMSGVIEQWPVKLPRAKGSYRE